MSEETEMRRGKEIGFYRGEKSTSSSNRSRPKKKRRGKGKEGGIGDFRDLFVIMRDEGRERELRKSKVSANRWRKVRKGHGKGPFRDPRTMKQTRGGEEETKPKGSTRVQRDEGKTRVREIKSDRPARHSLIRQEKEEREIKNRSTR